MKLTRLRLHGFKSFVEAADIPIQPGITGIVGPNGCGKSNLVEALRFVMGESSYKAMRGGGMDDVIFSGSGNRPARNIAEVTLAGEIDAKMGQGPEAIEITRRIEREAGSTYKINGREVRARDVQLLFADASTGAHSSALVRQGQIAELIAAKPEKRRTILEDAAGISGLHARRGEAEQKLKAAEQNIERLDDVMSEIATRNTAWPPGTAETPVRTYGSPASSSSHTSPRKSTNVPAPRSQAARRGSSITAALAWIR